MTYIFIPIFLGALGLPYPPPTLLGGSDVGRTPLPSGGWWVHFFGPSEYLNYKTIPNGATLWPFLPLALWYVQVGFTQLRHAPPRPWVGGYD